MRRSSPTRPAALAAAAAVIAALGTTIPVAASAAPVRPLAAHPTPATAHAGTALPAASVRRPSLPADERYVCPAPSRPGQMACQSIIRTGRPDIGPASAAATNGNYGPSQLRAAYKIATAAAKKGKGVTVAIVDAFSDPHLAADLAHYRSHFHLPACTTKNGCLKILNQAGKTGPLPRSDAGWAVEESLDVDMVSAICPNCHIMLVEAKDAFTNNLGAAVQTAVKKGARFVSNSWSGFEFFGQDVFNADFNHPGDVIAFAAGDSNTSPQYPTDLQYVTAVGGTTLKHAGNKRGWTETAWGTASSKPNASGTGGGCSVLEPKPSWQRADANAATGCLNRTETDVSAVADPNTGVLIFDTFKVSPTGLLEIGGTSAATPIITAIYALAGTPTKGTYPSEYPYLHTSHLFDVTSGVDGVCESFRQYICHGRKGYDGPTGLGTPNGTTAFANGSHRVTVVDPGTQDAAPGDSFSMTVKGLDSVSGHSLRWSATGLPAGLSISSSGALSGKISGTLPGTAGTFHVTVTAKDGSVSATTHFNIVTVTPLTVNGPGSGKIVLAADNLCLDGGTGASGQPVKVQTCGTQNWQFASSGKPDDVQSISDSGECLTVAASAPHDVSLSPCSGAASQAWEYLGFGAIWSPLTGGCIADSSRSANTQVTTAGCTFGPAQAWSLPAGPITTNNSLCLNNPSGSTLNVVTCSGANSQAFALLPDGTIASDSGKCVASTSLFAQSALTLKVCNDQDFAQLWETGAFGMILNINSNMCIADKNNGGSGSAVVQNDCYGDPGENWGLN